MGCLASVISDTVQLFVPHSHLTGCDFVWARPLKPSYNFRFDQVHVICSHIKHRLLRFFLNKPVQHFPYRTVVPFLVFELQTKKGLSFDFPWLVSLLSTLLSAINFDGVDGFGTCFFHKGVVFFGHANSLCILAGRLARWIFRLGVSEYHLHTLWQSTLFGNRMDRMISMNIEEILLGKRVTSPVPRSRWSSMEMNRLTWQKICQTLVFVELPKSVLFWSIRTSRVMQLERFRAVQNRGGVACFHLQHHCNSPYRNLAH